MNNLKTLEEKYLELGKEIEALKCEYKSTTVKRSVRNGMVVKFTLPNNYEVVWKGDGVLHVGEVIKTHNPISDNTIWEDVAYDSERDLFDGQPIYVYDNRDLHSRAIRFYDAISKKPFTPNGKRGGIEWDNYEAILPKHYMPWVLEAFETLNRSK